MFSVVGQLTPVNLNDPFRRLNVQLPDPRDIDDLFIRIDQLIEDVRRDEQVSPSVISMTDPYAAAEM